MQVMKKNDSIDYLKAFAAILVVTHHAILYSGADVTAGILEKLFTLIISVHVPLFFMIAGYLCRRQPLMPYFRKNFLRIIVPFVTFSLLKILYSHWISDEFAHAVSLPDQLIDAFVMGGLLLVPLCHRAVLWLCCAALAGTDRCAGSGVGCCGGGQYIGRSSCGRSIRLFSDWKRAAEFLLFPDGYAGKPVRRWTCHRFYQRKICHFCRCGCRHMDGSFPSCCL